MLFTVLLNATVKYFYYYITKKENREEEILSYDLQGNKKSKLIDVIEITISMYDKSYIKKMEELKIFSPGRKFWKKQF